MTGAIEPYVKNKPNPSLKSDESGLTSWEFSENEDTGHLHVSKRNRGKTTASEGDEETVAWTYWFKQSSFYIYGFVYMGVRMLVNVQSVKNHLFYELMVSSLFLFIISKVYLESPKAST